MKDFAMLLERNFFGLALSKILSKKIVFAGNYFHFISCTSILLSYLQ